MIMVTVEQSRTASREYLISLNIDNKTIFRRHSAGHDAGGAAAQAVRTAMGYKGEYCIIAESEVSKFIPPHFLYGKMNED